MGQGGLVRELLALARTLLLLDQTQWERDRLEEVGMARGGSTSVNVQTTQENIQAAALIRAMLESGQLGIIGEPLPPNERCAPSAPDGAVTGGIPLGGSLNEAEARGFDD
jgi:hypothetical protein